MCLAITQDTTSNLCKPLVLFIIIIFGLGWARKDLYITTKGQKSISGACSRALEK